MPRYFLSYIEVNGHSSMMLSVQGDPNQLPFIETEVGFGCNTANIPTVSAFKQQPGAVFNETNASKTKYSGSAKVLHKTYEISEEEMDRFIAITERDAKAPNPDQAKDESKLNEPQEGTPDYQLFIMNCKFYALGVLKEVGITEVEDLANFLIQRPGSTDDLLFRLKKSDYKYVLKDRFIIDLSAKANDLMNTLNEMKLLLNALQITYRTPGQNLYKSFAEHYDKAQKGVKYLQTNGGKAGFDPNFINQLNDCVASVKALASFAPHIRIPEVDGYQSSHDKLEKLMARIVDMQHPFEELQQRHVLIANEYEGNRTLISWSNMPSLTQRRDLRIFSENERMVYFRNARVQEINQGIDHIISLIDSKRIDMLNQKSKDPKQFDPDHFKDLNDIIEELFTAKAEVESSQANFSSTLKLDDKKSVTEACSQHDKNLDSTLEILQKKIVNFDSAAIKKTSPFLRLIYQVLAVLRIKPLNSSYSAKLFTEKSISQMSKQQNEKIANYSKRTKEYTPQEIAKKKEFKPARPSKFLRSLFPKQNPEPKKPEDKNLDDGTPYAPAPPKEGKLHKAKEKLTQFLNKMGTPANEHSITKEQPEIAEAAREHKQPLSKRKYFNTNEKMKQISSKGKGEESKKQNIFQTKSQHNKYQRLVEEPDNKIKHAIKSHKKMS